MNYLLWLGLIVAIWRVTRFMVKDELPLIKIPREWIMNTFWSEHIAIDGKRPGGTSRWSWFWRNVGHSFAYLWTCPWCMSFWVGVGLWWVAVWAGFSVPLPWILVAAGSGLSGLLISIMETRHDQAYEEAERRLGR